ncbi:hypothetical protein LWI28_025302 [Acer negundo]|uniref:phosphatidate cytidylyltransferase n=1 Tax=Acer negundo TaxID=4023 RepID=A0AAD5NYF0_ACENE|nr:hypothetical protein LWI28_025302 [Acer negundo]
MWIRAYSAMWMLLGFLFNLYLGHLYIWALVVVIQIYMAKELFNLLKRAPEDRLLPGSRLLNWFHVVYSFLEEEEYQFSQYAWTHMILIVVFAQSSFLVANIFQGILWFLLPASLIAINDVAAYFFGIFFGKTPLIKLSPKKTWEGFIGASVATFANILGRFQWLTCPRKVPSKGISVLPVQWHALRLGLFASIISPFGGFFAIGFKRAFKIKDFVDSIPGHGGVTDRNDCQMVMAVFTYIYHQSFVVPQSYSVEIIMDEIMRSLNLDQQQALHVKLRQILHQRQFGL